MTWQEMLMLGLLPFFDEGDNSGEGDEDLEDTELEENQEDENSTEEEEDKPLTKKEVEALLAKTKADAVKETEDRIKAESDEKKRKDDLAARRKAANDSKDVAAQAALDKEEAQTKLDEADRKEKAAQKVLDDATKLSIVNKYKLDADDIDRLKGSNKEEWEADAKKLSQRLGGKAKLANREGGMRSNTGSATKQKEVANNYAAKPLAYLL